MSGSKFWRGSVANSDIPVQGQGAYCALFCSNALVHHKSIILGQDKAPSYQ